MIEELKDALDPEGIYTKIMEIRALHQYMIRNVGFFVTWTIWLFCDWVKEKVH